jgi:hypothetical protein
VRPIDDHSKRLPAVRRPRRITLKRQRMFLRELAAHGSWAEAARVASPHAKHPLGPASSFRDLANRDPDFKAQCDGALEAAEGRLEREAWRRAVEGYSRPIYQQGRKVGDELVFSDAVLIKLLSCRIARYMDRSKLDINAAIDHRHIGLMITSQDLLFLSDDQRSSLELILEVIADARGEPELHAPRVLDAVPEP